MSTAQDGDGSTHSSTTVTHSVITTTSYTCAGPRTSTTNAAPLSQTTTVVHPIVTTTHQVPLRPPGNRRRSSSEPWRPQAALLNPQDGLAVRTASSLHTVHEEASGTTVPQPSSFASNAPSTRSTPRRALPRQASAISIRSTQGEQPHAFESDVVDLLDVIDPEVSTLTTLNNVQNSLFIPNLGWLYNRQPTYELSRSSPENWNEEAAIETAHSAQGQGQGQGQEQGQQIVAGHQEPSSLSRPRAIRLPTTNTISSVLTGTSEGHNYAVLPHGASLPEWTREDKAMLNKHVRHLLHSRRAKFKRRMRGFGRYVCKPVGFLVTLYAFLLTFWGAAWVLFLIGWISVGGRQAYFIEICDQVLTALFCVVGIGFAPWRAIDTYHMFYVAKYAHMTWRLRKERGLPALTNHNDLPTIQASQTRGKE